jgi:hypothetical protein
MDWFKNRFLKKPYFPFAAGLVITIVAYLGLYRFFKQIEWVYNLFFGQGANLYIQSFSTWLYFTILISFMATWFRLHEEHQSCYLDVSTKAVYPEDAAALAQKVPEMYRNSIFGQRVIKLLMGHTRGDDVGMLAEELARQDQERIERESSLIEGMKYLILLLGFGGTVLGLYNGMESFPKISQAAHNIEQLRQPLQNFGASFSMAFGTTLLALAYTVVLMLCGFVVHGKQRKLIARIDEKVQGAIRQFVRGTSGTQDAAAVHAQSAEQFFSTLEKQLHELSANLVNSFQSELKLSLTDMVNAWMKVWHSELSQNASAILTHLSSQNGRFSADVVKAIQDSSQAFAARLEQMEKALSNGKMHRYQVTLQPVEEGMNNVQ